MATTATRTATDWLADALLDLAPGQRVFATDIPWAVYTRLADLRDGRRPGVKITFDRGRIEIMSPSFRHEKPSLRLGFIVVALVEELGLEVVSTRTTTIRQEDAERGVEPDDCFYVAHYADMVGVEDIDLSTHPRPDLVIEVDATNSSVPKEPIYAPIGVPELWRHDDGDVAIRLLQADQTYRTSDRGLSFPRVTPDNLTRLLFETNHLEDIAAIRHYRAWAKTLVPPPAQP
jgi:Uma2 family endonuclease